MTSDAISSSAKTEAPPLHSVRRRLDAVDWDFAEHVPNRWSSGIHSLHWYPAPFPPGLAATLTDILCRDPGLVVDPFVGSGVGLIEAWLRGRRVFGLDVNKFAVDLAAAKFSLLVNASQREAQLLGEAYMRYRSRTIDNLADRPLGDVCDELAIQRDAIRWFEDYVLREIATLKKWIAECCPANPAVWIVLSSILHRSSILRDVHYTYIVDKSKTVKPPKSAANAPKLFTSRLMQIYRTAERVRKDFGQVGIELAELPQATILHGQAENFHKLLAEPADLVLTSPPYFGMNDYVRSQYLSFLVRPWPSYERDLAHEVGSRRSRRSPVKLDEYLDSMSQAFRQMANVLTVGKYAAVVVGASTAAAVRSRDPLGTLKAEIGRCGFELVWERERRVQYRKINNSPVCRESLWVLVRV